MVTEKGPCIGQAMRDFLESHGHARFWLFDHGNVVEAEDLEQVMDGLSAEDVFVKAANAIDAQGHTAVMLGMENGGIVGKALGHVMAKGIRFIVPVGLEKMVWGSIPDTAREMGIGRLKYSSGMPVGMIPLVGQTVTEIEALQQLADIRVRHVASGGVARGEGSVTLLVKGAKSQIRKVLSVYKEMREDNRLAQMVLKPSLCGEHKWRPCIQKNIFYKDNVKKGL
jgi:hypothetical protein